MKDGLTGSARVKLIGQNNAVRDCYLEDSDDITISIGPGGSVENNVINPDIGIGVQITRDISFGGGFHRVRINNNYIYHSGVAGRAITADDTTIAPTSVNLDAVISKNTISAGSYAVDLDFSGGPTTLANESSVKITENHIDNTSTACINLDEARVCVVSNNFIHDCGAFAVGVSGGVQAHIDNNFIGDWDSTGGIGISYSVSSPTSDEYCKISNNFFKVVSGGSALAGIYVSGWNCTISNNTCDPESSSGPTNWVQVVDVSCEIYDNHFGDTSDHTINASYTGTSVTPVIKISGNKFDGSAIGYTCIYASGYQTAILGNSFTYVDGSAVELEEDSNAHSTRTVNHSQIIGNHFTNVQGKGSNWSAGSGTAEVIYITKTGGSNNPIGVVTANNTFKDCGNNDVTPTGLSIVFYNNCEGIIQGNTITGSKGGTTTVGFAVIVAGADAQVLGNYIAFDRGDNTGGGYNRAIDAYGGGVISNNHIVIGHVAGSDSVVGITFPASTTVVSNWVSMPTTGAFAITTSATDDVTLVGNFVYQGAISCTSLSNQSAAIGNVTASSAGDNYNSAILSGNV
jgi:hypothetical protein